jgi:hypothetical protein
MRTFFSRFGKLIWRMMIIFSFVVNLILVVVLLGLGLLIFEIKNNVADPLVGGLHGSFVGLDQATIDWTIPVRETIPVRMIVPLETDTTVVLTQPVPLSASATITLNGANVSTPVSLSLPAGMRLPVHLDLDVPIDQPLAVNMDVRAVIPLGQTQLHDVADNLRLLFEPLAVALDNLPSDFNEAGTFINQLVSGTAPNLLEPGPEFDPWPGFSQTAGLNYDLFGENVPGANRPVQTGIVQQGGIPFLDQQIRPDVHAAGGPQAINAQAEAEMTRRNIPPLYYDGNIGEYIIQAQQMAADAPLQALDAPPPDYFDGGSASSPAEDGAAPTGPGVSATPSG